MKNKYKKRGGCGKCLTDKDAKPELSTYHNNIQIKL